MASVTNILDRASRITGFQATSTERTDALQYLNDRYKEAVFTAEADGETVDYTFTASSDVYDVSAIATDIELIQSIRISGNTRDRKLLQKSLGWIDSRRTTSEAGGYPRFYAMIGSDEITFFPNPRVDDVITVSYLETPPTLVESAPSAGEESTPTAIPASLHRAVLLNGLVADLLLQDQRIEEAEAWERRYEKGVYQLSEWANTRGGSDQAIQDHIYTQEPSGSVADQHERWI